MQSINNTNTARFEDVEAKIITLFESQDFYNDGEGNTLDRIENKAASWAIISAGYPGLVVAFNVRQAVRKIVELWDTEAVTRFLDFVPETE